MGFPTPDTSNGFLKDHVELLLSSFKHWTGREILEKDFSLEQQAHDLFYAPFAVASHDTCEDPVLNYGNQTALDLWETSWEEFTRMPSRLTAEAVIREERKRLLEKVNTDGFIDDYRGVRISTKGKRFMIEKATVWNLINAAGDYRGQAVVFSEWKYI
ncbi:MAG: MEKHLA domain-containing protein [Deltaproteobacteria bacterium]|nr:MEKHLA domain-containing protein [Deltaproteobacteria bacterium]